MDEPINFVAFSGTDDKLQALAVMTAGAAALGKPVNIFLQYWALDAFSKAKIDRDHGLAPEAGAEGRAKVDAHHEGRPGAAGPTTLRHGQGARAGSTSRPARCPWTSSASRSRTSIRSSTAWRA